MDGGFLARTDAALHSFQTGAGIDTDRICGPQTWTALVEAGRTLGERLLYLHTPAQRGDDVVELQRQLSTLGFSLGRLDGILDQRTAHALVDFQRNCGLISDGICGPDTLNALQRFTGHLAGAEGITHLTESEQLRHTQNLLGCRIAVGEQGGLDAAVTAVRRLLSDDGATVLTVHHPDWSVQAAQVNEFGALVYIGLEIRPQASEACFYESEHDLSVGGRRLAHLLAQALSDTLRPVKSRGMRLPVLRETRMTAVLCRLSQPDDLVRHNATVARTIRQVLREWVLNPTGEPEAF